MNLFKKTLVIFGITSIFLSGDGFARRQGHIPHERTDRGRGITKPRVLTLSEKKIRERRITKPQALTSPEKKARRRGITKPRVLTSSEKKAKGRKITTPRVPVSHIRKIENKTSKRQSVYYKGGTLAQRTSRYYEGRGYVPGSSGTFTMTRNDILGGPRYLHQFIPGFDENSSVESYLVPHEKVTDMINKLKLYKEKGSK